MTTEIVKRVGSESFHGSEQTGQNEKIMSAIKHIQAQTFDLNGDEGRKDFLGQSIFVYGRDTLGTPHAFIITPQASGKEVSLQKIRGSLDNKVGRGIANLVRFGEVTPQEAFKLSKTARPLTKIQNRRPGHKPTSQENSEFSSYTTKENAAQIWQMPSYANGIKKGAIVIGGVVLVGCSVIPTQSVAPQSRTEVSPNPQFSTTETAPTATPGPESLLSPTAEYSMSPKKVRLTPVDLSNKLNQYELSKTRTELLSGKTPIDLCREDAGVQLICLTLPFSNTKFELVGALDIKDPNQQSTKPLEKVYYFTGENGLPNIGAERVLDGNTVMSMLTGNSDYKKKTGYESWGYYTQNGAETNYYPVLVYDPLSGKLWYLNQLDKTIFEVEKPETIGTGGVLAIPVDVSKPVESAQSLMKDQQGWYFKYSDSGDLQIFDASGKILYNKFDEKTGQWLSHENIPIPNLRLDLDSPLSHVITTTEYLRINDVEIQIAGAVFQDRSVSEMTGLVLPEDTAANFLLKSVFYGWWTNGYLKENVPYKDTTEDFSLFVKLVSDIQAGNEDPLKIAFKVWLGDSNNPKQPDKMFYIVPFISGNNIPTEIDGVQILTAKNIKVGLARKSYINKFNESGQGAGTFFDPTDDTLYILLSPANGIPSYNLKSTSAETFSMAPWWLNKNRGQRYQGYVNYNPWGTSLKKLLLNGGYYISVK